MYIKDFRAAHSEDVHTLSFSNIFLTENVHVKGLTRGDTVHTQNVDPILIVRKIDGENDKYALVSGYNGYITALMGHYQEVKAIIIPDKSRKAFFKSLMQSPEMFEVANIKTPKGWTPPRPEKVDKCIVHYNTVGTFGKNIVVDESNTVLDGYAAVVAAKQLNVKKVFVLRVSKKQWTKLHSKKKFKKNLLTNVS